MSLFAFHATCIAEQFYLTDVAGKKHGPFEFAHGQELRLDGKELAISIPRIEFKNHELANLMKKTIIPTVDFRQANIRDVITFLSKASHEYWPEASPRGIGMILKLDDDPLGEKYPLITFNAQHISLYEALDIVGEIAKLEIEVKHLVLMIEPITPEKEKVHQQLPQVQK